MAQNRIDDRVSADRLKFAILDPQLRTFGAAGKAPACVIDRSATERIRAELATDFEACAQPGA
jgi:hypothetical protein